MSFSQDTLFGKQSLRQMAHKQAFPAKSPLLAKVMKELAITVYELAHYGVSHRYLRPEFIFFNQQESTVTITHFDMACFAWRPDKTKVVPRNKGLPDQREHMWDHLPPECFTDSYDAFPVDIWSFGVVLVYCLTDNNPFTVPHTLEKAKQAWTNFKNQTENADFKPYFKILDRIFVSPEKRLRSDDLTKTFGHTRSS